ncbi:hypothetical protein XbC2_150 [Xanthomonas phage XbC2]|nr:hypothetical protein XbC2_150 [Xanthomonas phage XbC2]
MIFYNRNESIPNTNSLQYKQSQGRLERKQVNPVIVVLDGNYLKRKNNGR